MKNADVSVAMGADKARHVRETGAEVLVAGDNSCLMHIGGRAVAPAVRRTRDAPGRDPRRDRGRRAPRAGARFVGMPAFPDAAREALGDTQLRHNLAHATHTIRDKRARVVAEVPEWEELRQAGADLKDADAAPTSTRHLEQLEER